MVEDSAIATQILPPPFYRANSLTSQLTKGPLSMGILIRRRRKETLTIKHEFVRIRRPREAVIAWCNQCSNETELLRPEDVAILIGVSAREIYRRVEIGDVHFTELSDGTLLICLNSILAKVSDPLNASNSDGLEWETPRRRI